MDHPMLQLLNERLTELKNLKTTVQSTKARRKMLSDVPVANTGESLKDNLLKILPAHLMPKNVGHLFHVQWPFEHVFDFDLSTTEDWPDISSRTQQTQSFTVSQEAAFLITSITRHAEDYSSAGDLGPLQVELRDRQSSRFFNNAPIPIQMFAKAGYETHMPTPFLMMPNAVVELIMTSWLDQGVLQNSIPAPSGIHQFTFKGFRVRVEDAEKVLSTIFSG